MQRDPDALVRFIHDEGITVWNSVPSLWLHLMDAAEQLPGGAVRARALRPHRRRAGAGRAGAPLAALGCPAPPVQPLRQRRDHRERDLVRGGEDPAPGDLHTPIGWPRAGTRVTLVDKTAAEWARSRVRRDRGRLPRRSRRLTAARFGPAGRRAYRTGDLARRLPTARSSTWAAATTRSRCAAIAWSWSRSSTRSPPSARPPGRRHLVRRAPGRRGRARPIGARNERSPYAGRPARLRGRRLPGLHGAAPASRSRELPRTPAGKADRLALHAGRRRRQVATELSTGRRPVVAALSAAWSAVLGLDAAARRTTATSSASAATPSAHRGARAASARDWAAACRRSPLPLPPLRRPLRAVSSRASSRTHRHPPPLRPPRTTARFPSPRVQRGFYLAQRETGRSPTWAAISRSTARSTWTRFRARRSCSSIPASSPARRITARHRAPSSSASSRTSRLTRPLLNLLTLRDNDLAARLAAPFDRRLDLLHSRTPAAVLLRLFAPDRSSSPRGVHHIIADGWSCFSLLSELGAAHDASWPATAGSLPTSPLVPGARRAEPVPARDEDRASGAPRSPASDRRHPGWQPGAAPRRPAPCRPGRLRRSRAPRHLPLRRGRSAFRRARQAGPRAARRPRRLHRDLRPELRPGRGRARGRPACPRPAGPPRRAVFRRRRRPRARRSARHGDAPAPAIAAAAGTQALARLGRHVLSWLDPDAIAPLPSRLRPDWSAAALRFDASTTGTEVMLGVMPHAGGLTLHLHGGELVDAIAAGDGRAPDLAGRARRRADRPGARRRRAARRRAGRHRAGSLRAGPVGADPLASRRRRATPISNATWSRPSRTPGLASSPWPGCSRPTSAWT